MKKIEDVVPSRSPIEEKDSLVKEVMHKLVSAVTFVEVDGTSILGLFTKTRN
jgi:hypothetical protein